MGYLTTRTFSELNCYRGTPTSFSFIVEKAKRGEMVPGSKYMQRIPLGFDETGKPKYRYIYNVFHAGRYVGHDDFHVEGAHVQSEHEGKAGHFHVDKVDGDKLTLTHSGSGKTVEMHKKNFASHLRAEHSTAILEHKTRLLGELEEASKSEGFGIFARETWRARVELKCNSYGIAVPGISNTEGDGDGEDINIDDLSDVAITLHEDILPEINHKLAGTSVNFPNPDGPMQRMFLHQKEGVERCMDSFQHRDAFLLQDEAGLGKTVTALGIVQEHAGKKNLVVVPDSGKSNHFENWQETGRLYNFDVRHHSEVTDEMSGAATPADGQNVYMASYGELFDTEMRVNEYGAKYKHVSLKPQFQGKFDLVLFDESHNMANPTSSYAHAGVQLQDNADKVVYMSATPYQKISDVHYLRKLGWFDTGDEFVKWAEKAGAKISYSKSYVGKKGTLGAIPYEVENPNSTVPLTTIAALLHVEGSGVKRQPKLTGLNNEFRTIDTKSLPDHVLHHMDMGNKIRDLAVEAGMRPFEVGGVMSLFSKSTWEAAKIDHAIDAAKDHAENNPGGQAAIFTEYTNHTTDSLKSLSRRIRTRVESGEYGQDSLEHADKIDQMLDDAPSLFTHPDTGESESAYDRIVRELGGPDNVAQIHGTGDATKDQQAYQNSEKKFVLASYSKGGTGLSFHDTTGDAPRMQINCSLPYSGMVFNQAAGRSHRLGSVGETNQVWLQGDDATEKRVSDITSAKLKGMGALTTGNPGQYVNSKMLQAWETNAELPNPDTHLDLHEDYHNGELGDAPEHIEAQNHFDRAVDSYRKGGDPLSSYGDKLRSKRDAEQYRKRRQAIATLSGLGVKIHNHAGMRYRIEADENHFVHDFLRKKAKRGVSVLEGGDIVVHDPRTFQRAVRELKLEEVPNNKIPKDLSDRTLSKLRQKHKLLSVGTKKTGVGKKKVKKSFGNLIVRHRGGKFSLLLKAKGVPVGTIHYWADGSRMKKVDEHHWVPVEGGGRKRKVEQVKPGEWNRRVFTQERDSNVEYDSPTAKRERKAGKTRTATRSDNLGYWLKAYKRHNPHLAGKIDAIYNEWKDLGTGGGGISRLPPMDVDISTLRINTNVNPAEKAIMQWWNPKANAGAGNYNYTYTDEHSRRGAVAKWERTAELFDKFPQATKHFASQFKDKKLNKRQRDAGAVMFMIAQTGLRVGYDSHHKRTGTRGMATLAVENVSFEGNTVHLDFIGKGNKRNQTSITNKALAQYLKARVKGKKAGSRVFDTLKGEDELKKSIGRAGFISGDGKHTIAPKDFRTVHGSVVAANAMVSEWNRRGLRNLPRKKEDALNLLQDIIHTSSEEVATRLCNTGQMARRSYIHPAVIQGFLSFVGGSRYEKEFFKKSYADLVTTDTDKVMRYGVDNWKPHTDSGPPGQGRDWYGEPESDAHDSILDGYLLPDFLM